MGPYGLNYNCSTKSGTHRVRRPALTNALKMAQQDKVDVIVCLKLARIDRKAPRRAWAIEAVAQFGVEFRFVNKAETRGKLPEGELADLQRFIEDMYDEREAKEIAERLSPGKLQRYKDGLPHGGSTGPDYGYAPGERRYKRGKAMGLLTWVKDEAVPDGQSRSKADWVRWLFDLVDATPVADLTIRGLTRALIAAGAPTATGTSNWGAKQVANMLHNGKYAGVGRNLRRRIIWKQRRDRITHERDETTQVKFRPDDETYAVDTDTCPPLISLEQYERVQEKLAKAAALNPRGGPRRTDRAAYSLVFDGYVRCAHCNVGRMSRKWDRQHKRPYYHCNKQSGIPSHQCKSHEINAWELDALVLRLLAHTITDPERIIELADAARGQLEAAESDAALTAASLAAHNKTLATIAAEQEKVQTALKALSGVSGMDGVAAEMRARVTALNVQREQVEADRAATLPAQARATERADFLRRLFTTRDWFFDFATGETGESGEPHLEIGWPGSRLGKDGEILHFSNLPLDQAAALLGVDEDQLDTLGLRIERGRSFSYRTDDGGEKWDETPDVVDTADVIECLLKRQPRDQFRKLLDDLEVVVLVTRPRSRAEWCRLGPTPVAERVSLQVLGTVVVRADAYNLTRLSQVTNAIGSLSSPPDLSSPG